MTTTTKPPATTTKAASQPPVQPQKDTNKVENKPQTYGGYYVNNVKKPDTIISAQESAITLGSSYASLYYRDLAAFDKSSKADGTKGARVLANRVKAAKFKNYGKVAGTFLKRVGYAVVTLDSMIEIANDSMNSKLSSKQKAILGGITITKAALSIGSGIIIGAITGAAIGAVAALSIPAVAAIALVGLVTVASIAVSVGIGALIDSAGDKLRHKYMTKR